MKTFDQLDKKEIIEAINKDWMTHDGMWFFHCVQKLGIEKTNELNLAAIEGLAQAEVYRIKKLLGIENETIKRFEELKTLMLTIKELFIPDFMGAYLDFSEGERLAIGMKPDSCFAYKGVKKLNVLDQYQCGVLYRIECMFRALDLRYQLSKPIGKCLMFHEGDCRIEFRFDFS